MIALAVLAGLCGMGALRDAVLDLVDSVNALRAEVMLDACLDYPDCGPYLPPEHQGRDIPADGERTYDI